LHDGRRVVVKVRRPWAVAQVDIDLALLERGSAALARHVAIARRLELPGLARAFATTLRQELDYVIEADHARRFARIFDGDPDVHVPAVVAEASTGAVLTLERVEGIKLDDVAALDAAGIDRRAVARRAAHAVLQMAFDHGTFHADLHPGNVFVQPDGSLALIDFGMVGTLPPVVRANLVQALQAVVAHDGPRLRDAVVALGMPRAGADLARLERDLLALVDEQLRRPLGDLSVSSLLTALLSVARRDHLTLPVDLALLARALAVCEGVGAVLDPSFQLATVLVPYLAGSGAPTLSGAGDGAPAPRPHR
jgi:ubiquinone biosynthesis protein